MNRGVVDDVASRNNPRVSSESRWVIISNFMSFGRLVRNILVLCVMLSIHLYSDILDDLFPVTCEKIDDDK